MATQPRAPFYAPRPSDDPDWQWRSPASSVIRQLAHQKFFGALGQSPTKLWSQLYTYIEPPDWAPTLENLNSSVIPPLSRLGIAKTYRWTPTYTFDDPGVWYPQVDNLTSALIQILGREPFSNEWQFTYDDASPWQLDTNWMSSVAIQILTGNKEPFHYQWCYNFDDASPWAPWVNRNQAALTPAATPFVNYTWRYNFDDASPWQVTTESLNSSVIQILSSGGKPFTTNWQFNFDDPALWSFTYQPNNPQTTLPPVLFFGPFYAPNPPDIQGWQWAAPYNIIIIPSGGKPVATAGQWNYNTDDASTWQWTPPNTITSQLVVYHTSGMGVIELDDPPVWSWSAQPKSIALTSATVVQPFSPRFIPTYDDPPGWTGGLRSVPMTLTFVPPRPFTPLQWEFGYDDSAVWTGQSHNAFFTQHQPIPFVAQMWNLNIPQDTPSSAYSTPAAALTLPAPVGATLIQRTLTGVGL
jgi:hypothetical protein